MMAHDPGATPPNSLAAETVVLVRNALDGLVKTPTSDGKLLREALQILAREAREKGVPPEQLLVVLKETWYALPALHSVQEPAEQVRLLQRVVTMCIKEYYGS